MEEKFIEKYDSYARKSNQVVSSEIDAEVEHAGSETTSMSIESNSDHNKTETTEDHTESTTSEEATTKTITLSFLDEDIVAKPNVSNNTIIPAKQTQSRISAYHISLIVLALVITAMVVSVTAGFLRDKRSLMKMRAEPSGGKIVRSQSTTAVSMQVLESDKVYLPLVQTIDE
jgi:hypothetical protein